MADEILLKWTVETGELKKAAAEVQNVTNLVDNMGKSVKSTFSEKAIQDATKKLYEQGDVMGALIEKYGSASSALKAMEKELQTMAVLGQRNTKEFKELSKVTAEFRDTVEDTRGEVKKMASDTRVFDTMVQGARGAAAAFSVFEGATAALGAENKDLQKTIMQVQGAMAVLTGVQELANLATEKGGIATQAYGLALKAVTAVEEAFAISSAAAWAVVTGGISLAVAGIALLVSSMGDAEAESDTLTESLGDQDEKIKDLHLDYLVASGAVTEFTASLMRLERERKKAIDQVKADIDKTATGKKSTFMTWLFGSLNPAIGMKMEMENYISAYESETKKAEPQIEKINNEFDEKERILRAKNAKKSGEDTAKAYADALGKTMKEQIEAMKQADKAAEIVTTVDTGIAIKTVTAIEQVDQALKKVDEPKTNPLKNWLDGIKEDSQKLIEYLNTVSQAISSVQQLSSAIFANEMQQIEETEKQKQLALDKTMAKELKLAGDNTEMRNAIEERYAKQKEKREQQAAIKTAQLKRKQAIADKAFSLAQAIIKAAEAAINAYAESGPVGAALAAAFGAVEVAAIAAQPIPEIPQFEKGGPVVLGGGRLDDGHLIGRSHRQGGILIEAEGGEFVVNKESAQRHADLLKAVNENRIEDMVFHRYIAPALEKMMPNKGGEFFDDLPLRNEVRNSRKSHTKDAEYIVRGISETIKQSGYNIQRYRV